MNLDRTRTTAPLPAPDLTVMPDSALRVPGTGFRVVDAGSDEWWVYDSDARVVGVLHRWSGLWLVPTAPRDQHFRALAPACAALHAARRRATA